MDGVDFDEESRNDVPNQFRRSFRQDRRHLFAPKTANFRRNSRTYVSHGNRLSLFPFSHFRQLHTMLPSPRNGSGTLRSRKYYSTVFRVVKLVSTKFFKKVLPPPNLSSESLPCPIWFHRDRRRAMICESITRFPWLCANFSQKIDTDFQQR